MDVSTGKTYKDANVSSTTSGWTEGATSDNGTVSTTTSGLMPTAKLTTPGADAATTADDEEIKKAFVIAANRVIKNRSKYSEKFGNQYSSIIDNTVDLEKNAGGVIVRNQQPCRAH